MSLLPARYNFTIWRGATFRKRITLREGDENSPPKDLTGYTAQCEIRDPQTDDELMVLESPDDIILGGAAGTIDVVIDEDVTESIAWRNATYELFIFGGIDEDRDILLYGAFNVRGG